MFKHCVLSVDFTPEWERTLDHLPALMPLLGIERLTLVYAVEGFKRQCSEDDPAIAERNLADLALRITSELGVQADNQVRHGFAASEVLQAARDTAADGVIALNRSHSASRELLVGNVVVNLARMSKLPLLILSSDGAVVEPHAPVVFATDGSAAARSAEKVFSALVSAGSHGLAVWVDADQHDDEEEAHRVLSSLASQHENVAARRLKGSAISEIVKAAEDEQAALLIIGKRGTTPIVELLIGSVAEGVARESRQPVLLVPTNG